LHSSTVTALHEQPIVLIHLHQHHVHNPC
jgi:hypothetical protein